MITIKTTEEQQALVEAGAILSKILKELKNYMKPGVTARELNDTAEKMTRDAGGTPSFLNYTPEGADRPYPSSLCVSINDEIVHGISTEEEKILKDGDIVTVDMGVTYNGMIVDAARTYGVGKIDETAKELLKFTRESLDAGIVEAVAGNHIGDISEAIEKIGMKSSFAIAEGLAGHGVGYKVHEDPYVPNEGDAGTGPLLKSGMVLAIEPMLCEKSGRIKLLKDGYTYSTKDGGRAAHFEDTVIITDGEPIVVTRQVKSQKLNLKSFKPRNLRGGHREEGL